MKKYQHQKDMNGCGVACMANLLNLAYDEVKIDFEKAFYKIDRGINIADITRFLETKGLRYKSKFFNRNKSTKYNNSDIVKVTKVNKIDIDKVDGDSYSRLAGSITLIAKSDKYPIGHYLLRVTDGWVDPWVNYPSIDNVHAGVRTELPGKAWYVLYEL